MVNLNFCISTEQSNFDSEISIAGVLIDFIIYTKVYQFLATLDIEVEKMQHSVFK